MIIMIDNKINNKNANKDAKNAVKTVSLIIFATAFSKVLGLLRDIIMVRLYGDSMQNTAFTTAVSIPLDFFDILFGAALLGVFIPVYNSFDSTNYGEKQKSEEFANIFLNAVILATGLLTFFGILFSKEIVNLIAADYAEETKELAAYLLRILFPMIVFTGAVYTMTGILQSKGEFLAPALVSSVSNIGVILYLLFFNKHFGVYGLSAAYLIAWFIQFATLAVPLARKKYRYKFILNFRNPAFARCIKTALPILAGAWLVPVSRLIAIRFSSMYENENSVIAAFTVSWRIFLLVTGILTYGICNYIFPKLAQNAGNNKEFTQIVKNGLSASFFIMAPVACIAFVLRGEAVAVLFMHGEFTPELARLAAELFTAFAPAMLMFSLIEILNRVFYSKNYVKLPMIAAISGIAVNFILCAVFIGRLNLAPVYITLSGFICQAVTAGILILSLKIKIKDVLDKNFFANIIKIVLSSGVLLIIIKILYSIINNNAFESNAVKNITVSAVILIAGLAVYVILNLILKTDEAVSFIKIYKTKK